MKRKWLYAPIAMLSLTALLSVPVMAAGNVSPSRDEPVPTVPVVTETPPSLDTEIFDDDVPLAPSPQTGYEE